MKRRLKEIRDSEIILLLCVVFVSHTHLLTLVRQVVAVHEASSLGGVAVQVYIIRHSAFLGRDLLRGGGVCHHRRFASVRRRLVLIAGPHLSLDSAFLPALLQLHRDL